MTTAPQLCWRRRYRWGLCAGSLYLGVALLSIAAHLADRHEYSLPLFVLVYASFPVYWLQAEVFKPQMAFLAGLPQGELIGFAILVGLTTPLYFGAGQLLRCLVRSRKPPSGPA